MNYVLFFPDELRAESLHCYGNPVVQTPHFDQLAQEGVLFEQCHVQNPVCSPSRCCLFSGQYVHVNGHRTLWNLLKPYEKNLLRYFKEAGYVVHIYGKNDLYAADTIPLSADVFTSFPGKAGRPEPDPESAAAKRQDFLFRPMEGTCRDHHDYADLKAGIDFIRGWKPGDRPFVLFLPLTLPHCPYTVPEPYYSMYSPDGLPPLREYGENKPSYHQLIREYRNLEGADLRNVQAVYLGMISMVDQLLGGLMDCLRETGRAADTMLIASADHGDYAGDYGLVEKWPSGMEDVLTRVPLIIRSPGCRAGHTVREQVEMFDIMPTMLESAGIPPQHTVYAKSLLPQLGGAAGDPNRAVFCEGGYNPNEPHCNEGTRTGAPALTPNGGVRNIYYAKRAQQKEHPESVGKAAMVRTLSYKLVRRSFGDHELYDLTKDPRELRNVYGQPEYAKIQQELEQRLLQWYLDTADAVPWEEDSRN